MSFTISVTGQIESAKLSSNRLYCKYSIAYGSEWNLICGSEEGITQISCSDDGVCVWNFPVNVALKSNLPNGWPQLVVCIYGNDAIGRQIVRGYGSTHIPCTPGTATIFIPLFVPIAPSLFSSLLSWFAGQAPEFLDPKFVCKSEGRQVVRVNSHGSVKVVLNVITKDMEANGWMTQKPRLVVK